MPQATLWIDLYQPESYRNHAEVLAFVLVFKLMAYVCEESHCSCNRPSIHYFSFVKRSS